MKIDKELRGDLEVLGVKGNETSSRGYLSWFNYVRNDDLENVISN